VENLEKARNMEKREKNISGHPQKKNNTSITLGARFWKEIGFPN
jgi:hypothetical protein